MINPMSLSKDLFRNPWFSLWSRFLPDQPTDAADGQNHRLCNCCHGGLLTLGVVQINLIHDTASRRNAPLGITPVYLLMIQWE